jgi:hypothetical protein
MTKDQIIKNLEKKHNIEIIWDNNEKTYAIYRNNKILTYAYSLGDINPIMALKTNRKHD